jgi:hypothetical protein
MPCRRPSLDPPVQSWPPAGNHYYILNDKNCIRLILINPEIKKKMYHCAAEEPVIDVTMGVWEGGGHGLS